MQPNAIIEAGFRDKNANFVENEYNDRERN